MITRVLGTALGAGFVAACVSLLLQIFLTTPLILRAETYEQAHAHQAAEQTGLIHLSHAEHSTASPSGAADEGWKPAEGLPRTAFTGLATLVGAVGYASLLLAVMLAARSEPTLRQGLTWALGGFAAVSLAPAVGLPPELPGMGGEALQARQLWWVATALGTGFGLYLLAVIRSPLAILLGLAAIVAPHVIGAPSAGEESAVPPALAAAFAARSIAVSAVFWAVLGLATGWIWPRLGEASARAPVTAH
jgi:cobalt transporter subunit CbtA